MKLSCCCTWFTTTLGHSCSSLLSLGASVLILNVLLCGKASCFLSKTSLYFTSILHLSLSSAHCFSGQALHVAGQVAGASVSTSPLPYGTMTSQCEALGSGTRKKLSSWLVNGHHLTPDNPVPSLPASDRFILPKV